MEEFNMKYLKPQLYLYTYDLGMKPKRWNGN